VIGNKDEFNRETRRQLVKDGTWIRCEIDRDYHDRMCLCVTEPSKAKGMFIVTFDEQRFARQQKEWSRACVPKPGDFVTPRIPWYDAKIEEFEARLL
jgi:hypothetical protein